MRDTPRHEIRDLNVSTSLRGDFAAAYLDGDQSDVLPTDTQKNTVFAYAKEHGVGSPEGFAIVLARHFVDDVGAGDGARVDVEEYALGARRRRRAPSTTTLGAQRAGGPHRVGDRRTTAASTVIAGLTGPGAC